MNNIFELKNGSDLYINGEIGNDFIGKDFINQLSGIEASEINMHIYSGGGDLFDALAVYDYMVASGKKAKCYISGLAGSAATVIACASEHVSIGSNSFYFVHNPISENDVLQAKAAETLVNIYKKKTGLSKDKIRSLLAAGDSGDFLTAKEALSLGFVDEVFNEYALAAHKPYEFGTEILNLKNDMKIQERIEALEASIKKMLSANTEPVTEVKNVEEEKPVEEEAPKSDALEQRVSELEVAMQELVKKIEEMMMLISPMVEAKAHVEAKAKSEKTKVVASTDPMVGEKMNKNKAVLLDFINSIPSGELQKHKK